MPRALFPSGRKLLLLTALIATAIGIAWWTQPRPPPDPVYGGQRLSEWIDNPESDLWNAQSQWSATRERLRGYGAAGVHWLAYQAEHGRHPYDKNPALPFSHAPEWLRRWVPDRWGGARPSALMDERRNAAYALACLGQEAAPAIPALARSLKTDRTYYYNSERLMTVGFALSVIGRAAWPAVQDALEHGSDEAKLVLVEHIGNRLTIPEEPASDTDMASIAQALLKVCRDPDAGVRAAAAQAIGDCHGARPDTIRFDVAVPELIRLLSDANAEVRFAAAITVGTFGTKGAPAVAPLMALLDDPSGTKVQIGAASALAKVDQTEKRSAARLRAMLKDPNPACRNAALKALKEFDLSSDAEGVGSESPPNL